MNQTTNAAVPLWYWVIGVVALLWNLLGCLLFGVEMFAQEAAIQSMTEEQKEWARSTPGWIYVVYGMAVSTTELAATRPTEAERCVALTLRFRWARRG